MTIEISKIETLFNNGFEFSACIYLNGEFFKEIGGFSTQKDLLNIIAKDKELWCL